MSTAPEHELPAEIEAALSHVEFVARFPEEFEYADAIEQAIRNFRSTIIAALEPERALRERAERLRRVVIEPLRASEIMQPGDLADDLTATSSTQEGRD